MKTLLTGANGLVGSSLPTQLNLSSKNDLDLRDRNRVFDYFSEHKPDAVIHTAAKVGGLGANMNFMSDFYSDNILINTNVLDAAQRNGVEQVVSFLSTCIFPDDMQYPLTEDMLHEGPPHASNFGYAYAKRMLEVQSKAISVQHGLGYSCVIPTNIYGPNDNFSLESGHVIPSLIHKCYLAEKYGTDFVVWGSGKPLREFIFSYDVGELVEMLMDRYRTSYTVILSPSEEVSIGHVAHIIAEAMGFKGKIVYDTTKSDGQFRKPTCNKKLQSLIPDYEFTPLEEGIQFTVDWFKENYQTCRK
jgi:GDP-L-fucose synthase